MGNATSIDIKKLCDFIKKKLTFVFLLHIHLEIN